MFAQHHPAKRISFAHCDSAKASCFGGKVKTAGQMPENSDKAVTSDILHHLAFV
jgi:hypothetical protein